LISFQIKGAGQGKSGYSVGPSIHTIHEKAYNPKQGLKGKNVMGQPGSKTITFRILIQGRPTEILLVHYH
jgi:hypothetical protein